MLAQNICEAGAKLIITARRKDRIDALASRLKKEFGTDVLTLRLDVRDQPAVEKAFTSLPEPWDKVDVLVNNAGLSRGLDKLHEGRLLDWEEMIDTNVKGLLYVSRA